MTKLDLVIGSNSYLGINLTALLDPKQSLLVSRAKNDPLHKAYRYCQHDFVEGPLALADEIGRIFILARPETEEAETLNRFYTHLKDSLIAWLKGNSRVEVHFLSTSLVYNSNQKIGLNAASPTAPEELYEREKLRFEKVLNALTEEQPRLFLFVYRIPLLVGGTVREKDYNKQIFYLFYQDIKEGYHWSFPDEKSKTYGTAWLDVEALARAMLKAPSQKTYHLFVPHSGFITYYEFMREAHRRLAYPASKQRFYPPRSYFYMDSPDRWGEADFWSVFKP